MLQKYKTNKMKQTAVEWLMEQMKDDRFLSAFEEVIKQAKEIEKQQIINSYWEGSSNWDSEKEAEQYYNETFKNK